MLQTSVILTLPVWMETVLSSCPELPAISERMQFVLTLARENVRRKTGGPFAAAVFNIATGALISAGVNRVIPCSCSIAHAEMMALALAQQALETYDLGTNGLQLVTSTEPCAMCLGALPWSGIQQVICGATDADARAAGFDEGTKVANWIESLKHRGIEVITEIHRNEAAVILKEYAETGGQIYNGAVTTG